MTSRKPSLVLCLSLCAVLGGGACSKAGSGPPYPPEEALGMFQLKEGFRIELAASEPQISDPVAMAFDAAGRLFVVELIDYPMGVPAHSNIKVLEDTDGDGYFEKGTLFAEGLAFPNSVLPWKGGILVSAAPDIYYLEDTDGDGKADWKEVILTGFNPFNPQLRVNGLLYGMDNWIYGAYPKVGPSRGYPELFGRPGEPIHFPAHPEVAPVDLSQLGMDFRFRPDQKKLEPAAGNSQFGNALDAQGNRFMLWNNNHIRHAVLEHRYLTRNPYLSVPSAMHFPSDHENQSEVYQITENPIYIHESQVGIFTSSCGNSVYSGGLFPEGWEGAYFVCEPVHNLVHSDWLEAKGGTFVARRAVEKAEFLASRDAFFKPVFSTTGPDGGLYIADYYRKYVEHPDYVPDEIEDQLDLRTGEGLGRIYRVVPEGKPLYRPQTLSAAASAQLVEHLSHPNLWWRLTAQRLLVERQDASLLPELRRLSREGSTPFARMHALWTLEGLGALEPGQVVQALEDGSPAVRRQAVRLAELVRGDQLDQKLLTLVEDPDEQVRFQLACALGFLPPERSFPPLRRLVKRHLDDVWFQRAALSASPEHGILWFRSLTGDSAFLTPESPAKQEFLRQVVSIIGARQEAAEMAEVVNRIARFPGPSAWWREAGLLGLAEGLKRGSQRRVRLPLSAEQALVSLFEADSPAVAKAALEAADQINLPASAPLRAVVARAARTASESSLALEERAIAVRLLAYDRGDTSGNLAARLLGPQEPLEIQKAAAAALVRQKTEESKKSLLDGWTGYRVPVRDIVWNAILNDPALMKAFLDEVEQGRIQPWTLGRPRIAQLTESPDQAVKERAARLFAEVSSDRGRVVERYKPALTAAGDFERGKEVFRKACSGCHQVGNIGVEVGPDVLDLAARRPKSFILNDVLDPNANISGGYEQYLVETVDGQSITGVIAEDSATSITLRRQEGQQDIVLRSNIRELRALTMSAMPEGLEEDLTIQEMADLLEFLQTYRRRARSGSAGD